ncbi:hypothetical protein BDV98DRAFT_576899 [Pterulicium gracile]|uniref:Uncharacterized protein n=1 Tax=Pterulicium gracile TaxID=1884261 RepID=A0A5C3Q1M4_9AGAR|nr:hypothetical protein BDV98DRAFT_576899 [Pterula gracilis]
MIRRRSPPSSTANKRGRNTTIVLLVCSVLSSASCKLVNEIIDDSDTRVLYTGVGWTAGQTNTSPQCSQVAYRPFTIDTSQVYQGTSHDNTGIDNLTDISSWVQQRQSQLPQAQQYP